LAILHEVIAKPLETLQTSVAVAEKWGSGTRVPGKFGGFAISSHDSIMSGEKRRSQAQRCFPVKTASEILRAFLILERGFEPETL